MMCTLVFKSNESNIKPDHNFLCIENSPRHELFSWVPFLQSYQHIQYLVIIRQGEDTLARKNLQVN